MHKRYNKNKKVWKMLLSRRIKGEKICMFVCIFRRFVNSTINSQIIILFVFSSFAYFLFLILQTPTILQTNKYTFMRATNEVEIIHVYNWLDSKSSTNTIKFANKKYSYMYMYIYVYICTGFFMSKNRTYVPYKIVKIRKGIG